MATNSIGKGSGRTCASCANGFKSKEISQALTVNDKIWKHCKHRARWLVSKICSVLCPKKEIIIKLCLASRMTFRVWFYITDPQNIRGQFGTLLESERAKKSPKIYFRPKSFRTIFQKRTSV